NNIRITKRAPESYVSMLMKMAHLRLPLKRTLAVFVFVLSSASIILAQSTTNYPLPVVSIRATDPSASESGDPGVFTVFRDGATNNSLNIFYLIGGSASNGVDYATLGNWVVMPAGARAAEIKVLPIDDSLVEGTETV